MPPVHWSDQIVSVFDTLYANLFAALAGFGDAPIPQSPAEVELRSADLKEHLQTAFSQPTFLIEAAVDHLSAFARAISQPALSISPWVSIRSVLEVSAISRWLLERDIGPQSRAARSLQFRCEGLTQAVKYAKATGQEEKITSVARHLAEVLEHASSHGLEVTRDAHGSPKSLADCMPSTTVLVQRFLQKEPAYRLLSAMVHGHLWALQQLAFSPVRENQPHLLAKTLSIPSIAYLGNLGLKAAEAPIIDKCILFGWPPETISVSFAQATQVFRQVLGDVYRDRPRPAQHL